MSEEIKNQENIELNEAELNEVAGGMKKPRIYYCIMCKKVLNSLNWDGTGTVCRACKAKIDAEYKAKNS